MRWLPQGPVTNLMSAAFTSVVLCIALMSCGTGIEVTEHVTDKDVRRVMEQISPQEGAVTLVPFEEAMSSWRQGKRFWVADNQIREMLVNQPGYAIDTVNLAGHVLLYQGSVSSGLFADDDNRVDIRLLDEADSHLYVYRCGLPQHVDRPYVSLPMLIDLDMVDHIARQICDKDFFIRTSIWYDRESEQMKSGRKYVKVHIDSVLPGNAVLPLRVLFTVDDSRERAMVWMSDNASAMHGRDFDALFVARDPHLSYPEINDKIWQLITRGQVTEGMTKVECSLSLGSPNHISERPDQGGMREYWYYDGGSYLYFVDGLLSQFRR